jgi:hypothetical protein
VCGVNRERVRESAVETDSEVKIALWRLEGSKAVILQFTVRGKPGPADVTAFLKDELPDLAAVRDRYRQHEDLWDQVRTDRVVAVFDSNELPVIHPGLRTGELPVLTPGGVA